jgi:hypothetical protein
MGIRSVIAPYALNFTENKWGFLEFALGGAALILASLLGMYESEEEAGTHFRHSSQRKSA